ncbi:hypothetical protein AKJ09_04254 [Labilithrix luteola]|uniref:Lipoprotein n=1 Tax=Labilithrix luteola TaxID=1391654 RepID=A0A0K1PVN3_9BACT|nr:hypothetical protein [Labilithrix luteola]AKU97590.1 hypothetical protein AKJ09_04254 [Labilithrix luteola]
MKIASLVVCFSLALVACGGPLKYEVPSSARAPGADAKVLAKVQKDQSLTELEIEATNLAPPGRVTDGATAYVVWHRKDSGKAWTRSGGLAYNESDRKGKWTGTVPETAFDLVISAEKDASGGSPSGETVFSQHVN